MDTMSPAARSRLMAAIRSKNTLPERLVRRMIHGMGYRFRINVAGLPGKPDIVLARHGKIVLVHGCFWHRHARCRQATMPKSRVAFWKAKFRRNVERDVETRRALRRLGWRVLVVWECELRKPERLEGRLRRFLEG